MCSLHALLLFALVTAGCSLPLRLRFSLRPLRPGVPRISVSPALPVCVALRSVVSSSCCSVSVGVSPSALPVSWPPSPARPFSLLPWSALVPPASPPFPLHCVAFPSVPFCSCLFSRFRPSPSALVPAPRFVPRTVGPATSCPRARFRACRTSLPSASSCASSAPSRGCRSRSFSPSLSSFLRRRARLSPSCPRLSPLPARAPACTSPRCGGAPPPSPAPAQPAHRVPKYTSY